MRDPKKRAISNACHWLNRCYDLGMTADEIVAISTASYKTASQKENGKGKEKSPPDPLIEKREREEKGAGEVEDACARDRLVQMVTAYNARIGGNIDAEYFVDYYADHWPRNWQARLRNWIREGKRSGRLSIETPALKAFHATSLEGLCHG